MARMTLDELRNRASTVDRAKVEATTETEIEAHRAADGDDNLPVPANAHVVESPRALRVRLALTQPEIAAALGIPLGTWRNWEQGRVSLEPAAVSLLRLVSLDPVGALSALGQSEWFEHKIHSDNIKPSVRSGTYSQVGPRVVMVKRQAKLYPMTIKRSAVSGGFVNVRAAGAKPKSNKPKTA
ncbi:MULTISPECIES: helix-turn-helix domain-containing protein [unclassified Methylobacterium]|uniref:helix-turn-helix domain-containing protein n=1 Tax=unclassified Methylobacterium TaxID=2615210 RepID=UPI00068A70EC|nr:MULTISPECIES: helix-turn-helix domain-containing protein [unclassified Methylobacterium]SFV07953.1 Helix-turn-helix domain-containing protein [Methylobacterium sp. UNCCL125]